MWQMTWRQTVWQNISDEFNGHNFFEGNLMYQSKPITLSRLKLISKKCGLRPYTPKTKSTLSRTNQY